jgi:hypothetical protein
MIMISKALQNQWNDAVKARYEKRGIDLPKAGEINGFIDSVVKLLSDFDDAAFWNEDNESIIIRAMDQAAGKVSADTNSRSYIAAVSKRALFNIR